MDIHEVVMVLHREAAPIEDSVVMMGCIHIDASNFCQHCIRFRLLAEEPDIDVATGPVFGSRPVEATGVAFQHHHPVAVSVIESRQ